MLVAFFFFLYFSACSSSSTGYFYNENNNDIYNIAIYGQMRLEETPKDQTAIPSEVPGPQLKTQPSAPTHVRSLAQSNGYRQKRFIRYWLQLDPREENIDGRRIKIFHRLEGSHKPSSLLSAIFCRLFLQVLAHLKSKRHIPISTVRGLNSESTSNGKWSCGCRICTREREQREWVNEWAETTSWQCRSV